MKRLLMAGCAAFGLAATAEAMPLGVRTAVWGHMAATRSAAPIPDLGENPSSAVIAYVLAEAVDPALGGNITDAGEYAALRAWAREAGITEANESPFAWRSFALGTDTVLTEDLEPGDVVIESFGPVERGWFTCVVRIAGVSVGKGAVTAETFAANVGKAFIFEGSETLAPAVFSEEAVERVLGVPKDGKAAFSLKPKVPTASFFVRARVK